MAHETLNMSLDFCIGNIVCQLTNANGYPKYILTKQRQKQTETNQTPSTKATIGGGFHQTDGNIPKKTKKINNKHSTTDAVINTRFTKSSVPEIPHYNIRHMSHAL